MNGSKTCAGAGLRATEPGATEPGAELLRVKEPALLDSTMPALLDGTVPALLFGLLSLVEPADLDVADHSAEQQGGFF